MTAAHHSISVLSAAEQLPLRSIEALVASPVLVVAPHPDDETLGCGGAIAQLRQAGCEVRVLVISDGTQSHPNSRRFPAAALRSLRESETLSALALLGVAAAQVTFLRLPDGAVPQLATATFSAAVDRCQRYLAETQPKLIFLPWRSDPHADHRATWQIMQAAIAPLGTVPRQLEYPIWDWDEAQRGRIASNQDQPMMAWRLDIAAASRLKQQAIGCYRSQTTDLIDDDPQGFCLSPEMLSRFQQPWEVFLEAPA